MLNWKNSKEINQNENSYTIPESWLLIHYYEALNMLFRIENGLRIFVYVILKNKFFDEWAEQSTTSDDSKDGTIRSIANMRIKQADNFGYLGYPISCPIMHLTSGELTRLITSDAYWQFFNEYFACNKEIMKNKLGEIGIIRNSLAHFRPIKDDDIELVKQNSKHVLLKIEGYILSMLQCNIIVPTNTDDTWYKEISGLIIPDILDIKFFQSKDNRWVKIKILYKVPIVSTKHFEKIAEYEVLNINSPKILDISKNITKYVTFLTENVRQITIAEVTNPEFNKEIGLLFDVDVLKEKFSEMKEDIIKILNVINAESDLVIKDNYAKGQLVHTIKIWAFYGENKRWQFSPENFNCPLKPEHPPEYWGQDDIYSTYDFLTHTKLYPWMSVEISKEEIPF